MRSTPNRKYLLAALIALIALIALVAVFDRVTRTPPGAASPARSRTDAPEAPASSAAASAPHERTGPAETAPEAGNAATRPQTAQVSRQRVFRMILEAGECRLEAVDEVAGDFRPRRGTEEAHAGMIACRLVGADGQIVAEHLVHPPDHACVVLDPHLGDDPSTPVMLSGLGPQVFQVRFPAETRGAQLEIYRITRTRPEPAETLLLTVPIEP